MINIKPLLMLCAISFLQASQPRVTDPILKRDFQLTELSQNLPQDILKFLESTKDGEKITVKLNFELNEPPVIGFIINQQTIQLSVELTRSNGKIYITYGPINPPQIQTLELYESDAVNAAQYKIEFDQQIKQYVLKNQSTGQRYFVNISSLTKFRRHSDKPITVYPIDKNGTIDSQSITFQAIKKQYVPKTLWAGLETIVGITKLSAKASSPQKNLVYTYRPYLELKLQKSPE